MAGRRGRRMVAFFRREHHHLYASFHGINQRFFDPAIREEIGVRDVDAFLRRCDREQEEQV